MLFNSFVLKNTRYFLYLKPCFKFTRTFLSESYSCTEAWNQRLKSSLLSKIKPRDFFIEIDSKMQSAGKIDAIDLDIYANTVNHPDSVDETINILHQFRMTAETSNTFESTHHAIIRYLLDCNETEELLHVLDDRLNYGIFPDHLCFNIIMNRFIRAQDFASAAKAATFLMLQEDNGNPISNALAIYCCHKYLEKPDTWVLHLQESQNLDEEVIKIRIAYTRNPFFDDHFDLREPRYLVGKTLVFFGKLISDSLLGRTCLIRGYSLWQKYDKAVELIDDWIKKGIKEVVYKDIIPLIKEEINAISEEQINEDLKKLKEKIENLKKCNLKDGNIIEEMEARIKEAVKNCEANDVANQLLVYKKWETQRMDVLNIQLANLDKETRLVKIQNMKEELEKQERLLTFFENEEKLELQIEKKLEWEEENFGPLLETTLQLKEDYIPPDVTSKSASGNID